MHDASVDRPTRSQARPGAPAAGRACSRRTCCKTALKQSFVMLRPDIQWKNPVMFVVEVGTVLTIIYTIAAIVRLPAARRRSAT